MAAAATRARVLRSVASVIVVAGFPAWCALPAVGSVLEPPDYVWLDVDDQPLPFQDKTTITAALRTATVADKEVMERGIAKNLKLVLELDGVRFKAVQRVINVEVREKTGSLRIVSKYRDTHIFELAAYELSELLGIGRVPPTVRRSIDGQDGTVQIWMERTVPEDIMLEEGRLKPPNREFWWRQKAVMWVFDALIANTDRNQGNLLIDEDWNLWFIDHTRAFRETSVLFGSDELEHCERSLWATLLETPDEAIEDRLGPYLTSKEMSRLLLRRAKLVKLFQKRIKKHGEAEVLFDLGAPLN